MTAASIAYAPSDAIDPVDVFIARCAAQAKLYAAGEFDQQEAVDVLQTAAERDGLVKALGQDRVQQIMANAFRPVREALGDFDIVLDAPISRQSHATSASRKARSRPFAMRCARTALRRCNARARKTALPSYRSHNWKRLSCA